MHISAGKGWERKQPPPCSPDRIATKQTGNLILLNKKPPHTRGQVMGIHPVYSGDIGLKQVRDVAHLVTNLSSSWIIRIDAHRHAVHADIRLDKHRSS